MQNIERRFILIVSVVTIVLFSAFARQEHVKETETQGFFFSTGEDFITQGPTPADGNPIISDGDLLHSSGYVYMRNPELLEKCCNVQYDLGLDAVDVIDADRKIVAFSTELDDPDGTFTAGDLMFTTGACLPNSVLLESFKIPRNLDPGLDAVQFVGDKNDVISFISTVTKKGKKYWMEKPGRLTAYLKKYGIDIWFSTDGLAPSSNHPGFLDGDLLSVVKGTVVLKSIDSVPLPVSADIPTRGEDFGMGALSCSPSKDGALICFSTKILYEGKVGFSDGDILGADKGTGKGVVMSSSELMFPFKPDVKLLGLDALSISSGAPFLEAGATRFNDGSVKPLSK